MKKNVKKLIFSGIILAGLIPALSSVAATTASTPFVPFTASTSASVSYGVQNNAAVAELQQILIEQSFLKGTAATGNFFSITKTALQAFQKAHGISTTGNFGPLTMTAVNAEIAVLNTPSSNVAIQSVSKPSTSLTAAVISFFTGANSNRTISWQTNGYSANTGININLIRETSPGSYSLIRQLATNIPNTGTFSWTPLSGETGNDIYAEVTCVYSASSTAGCQVSASPIQVK
jgi:peptidoglycan hydrolase-like protein with peptidoglycan-binding domain